MSAAPAKKRKLDPKTANILYHDAAARSYDDKWSISFDERCLSYVRDRADRMLPRSSYDRVLEIGVPVDLHGAGDVAGVVEEHVLVGFHDHEAGVLGVLGEPVGGDQPLGMGVTLQLLGGVRSYGHGAPPFLPGALRGASGSRLGHFRIVK